MSDTAGAGKQPGRAALRWVFDVVRWALCLGILVGGVIALNGGHLDTCEQRQSLFGQVSEVCHRPGASDPVVLGTIFVVVFLLLPDLSEFSVVGLASVKMRLRAQEAHAAAVDAEIRSLKIELTTAAATATAGARAQAQQNVYVSTGGISAKSASTPPDGATTPLPAISPGGAREASDEVDFLAELRLVAADAGIRSLLDNAARDVAEVYGITDVRTHLYFPDENGVLLPVDERERPSDDAGWAPGDGVVGTVWETGLSEVRRGEETQRGLGDLLDERRGRYASTRVVLGVPARNFTGRCIGVVSASSDEPGRQDKDSEALLKLEAHAQALSRVLVDLLGWDADEPIR